MKKIFALLFIVTTVFAAVGCSKSDPADEKGPAIDAAKDAGVEKSGGAAATPTKD